MSWLFPTLWWYIATLIATVACLPLTLFLFQRTVGQGAGFARPLAMLLTVWPVWFVSSWLGISGLWSGTLLWAFLLLTAIIGWIQVSRRKLFKIENLHQFVLAEVVFLVVFVLALWFRGYGPQADFTEKPSELMMLSSVLQSSSMPPIDAWLSGETLNYYYMGYAIWGGFGKMTFLAPSQVFNLALVSTFAMAFVAIAGLVGMVLGRFYGAWSARIGGLVAAIMTLVMGNLWSSWRWAGGDAGDDYWGGIGWNASRIIRDSRNPDYGFNPITEFPSFSFILGDLHPHVMALPFVATALGIAWVLLTLGRLKSGENFWQRDFAFIALSGAVLGSLYVINSWDFPTYAGIAALALMLGTVGIGWRHQAAAILVLGVSALVAWLPFYIDFVAPANPIDSPFSDALGHIPIVGGVLNSIGIYDGLATTPTEFFSMFGFQYIILLVLILVEVVRRREPVMSMRHRRVGERPEHDPASGYLALAFGALCLIGAIVVPVHLLIFCGLPVIVIWLLLERDARLTPANISLVIFALALLLLLVPEFFYISDIYSGSRMNTVFKISYQVWFLMSVASSIGIVSVWKAVRFNSVLRYAMPVATAAMLLFGMVYPVVGGQQWLDWRNPERNWSGIDGLAYLTTTPDSPQDAEYEAIEWMLENAGPNDVILTTGGGEWDSAVGRISSGSGVPAIIGWIGHERQWHLGDEEMLASLPERISDIDAMFAQPPDPALLDKYGVTYIYIGPNELYGTPQDTNQLISTNPIPTANDEDYPGDGWELVFQRGDVRIYERIDESLDRSLVSRPNPSSC